MTGKKSPVGWQEPGPWMPGQEGAGGLREIMHEQRPGLSGEQQDLCHLGYMGCEAGPAQDD